MSVQHKRISSIRACIFSVVALCISQILPAVAGDLKQGSVVITELMPNIENTDVDWIELHNPTQMIIELKGCIFTDDQGDKVYVDQSLLIEPSGYVVIASGKENGANYPESLTELALEFSLKDFQLIAGPDQVELTCNGTMIDRVAYAEYNPGPATGSRGWQLEPNSLDSELNDDASNWCYTNLPILSEVNLYGENKVASPGRENPPCANMVLPYLYVNDQTAVHIPGIDFETTLQIAAEELSRDIATAELTIWGIRDQVISPDIAKKISKLYHDNIEGLYHTKPVAMIDSNHAVWHFAWAIANLYRNGNSEVKAALQSAYDDAIDRPQTIERFRLVAIDNVLGDQVLMGDAHDRARSYVRRHVVVPGNLDFVQSYEEYLEKRRSGLEIILINLLYNAKTFYDRIIS